MNASAASLPDAPVALKCACADLWSHPMAQLLAGPALRPGGRALTRSMIGCLALAPDARALDIGSGTGVTLAELTDAGARAFGVDYSGSLAAQAAEASPVAVGDAESLPYLSGTFDAVFVECVLSAVPDKPAALRECRRVLASGGRLVVTDMTVRGEFPEPLQSLAAWAACVGGASSTETYVAMLCEAGFVVESTADATSGLRELVDQAERRLAMLRGALGVGLLEQAGALVGELARYGIPVAPDELEALADVLFAQVRGAIDAGDLGYASFVAVA
jgi:ubiquinone/menaquinone biosynthesis C-methylase UbiE